MFKPIKVGVEKYPPTIYNLINKNDELVMKGSARDCAIFVKKQSVTLSTNYENIKKDLKNAMHYKGRYVGGYRLQVIR